MQIPLGLEVVLKMLLPLDHQPFFVLIFSFFVSVFPTIAFTFQPSSFYVPGLATILALPPFCFPLFSNLSLLNLVGQTFAKYF
jgi:hypothetical protein